MRHFIIIERTKPKNFWGKIPYKKEIFLLIFGAIVSLGASLYTTSRDESNQEKKEMRERKELFVDNYLKELNRLYSLGVNMVNEDANVKETEDSKKKVADFKNRINEGKLSLRVNDFYDYIQFHRYFENDDYYDDFKSLNNSLNHFLSYAESGKKDIVDSLRHEQEVIFKRIVYIEKKIYSSIDSSSTNR